MSVDILNEVVYIINGIQNLFNANIFSSLKKLLQDVLIQKNEKIEYTLQFLFV